MALDGFLSSAVKLIKVSDPTTTGTSAVNSGSADMWQDGGYDAVMFFTSLGTAAANNTCNLAQSTDDSSFADLTGTSAVEATAEDVWLDVIRPNERYVRLEIARGTSTTVGDIWAILYKGRGGATVPNNVLTGTIVGEQHVDVVEGTA